MTQSQCFVPTSKKQAKSPYQLEAQFLPRRSRIGIRIFPWITNALRYSFDRRSLLSRLECVRHRWIRRHCLNGRCSIRVHCYPNRHRRCRSPIWKCRLRYRWIRHSRLGGNRLERIKLRGLIKEGEMISLFYVK